MKRSQAELLAGYVVSWLAQDTERMSGFLLDTGLKIDDLRAAVEDAGFLAAVMDWLLAGDDRVVAFCKAYGLTNNLPAEARKLLPGGDDPHWT